MSGFLPSPSYRSSSSLLHMSFKPKILHAIQRVPSHCTESSWLVRIMLGSPIITFPHQKVETFFEVAIAHTLKLAGDWDSIEGFRPWHRA